MRRGRWLVGLGIGLVLGQAQAVTLTVWTHFTGQDLAWVRAQSAGYTQATGVQVRVTSVAFGDLIERWEGARARPDVVVGVPDHWLPGLAAQTAPQSRAPREAEALARHLTRPDAQLHRYMAGGRLPAHPAAQAQLQVQQDPWSFIQAVRAGRPEAAFGNDGSAWDRAQVTLEGALGRQGCR
ncbi:hypothetical protein [Deinococcus soli (ex Cha et al. 2016)]|uniref:Maltose-binding protein MalE n=2 Tax=Deinococcus soli (ex Cha et al. 2016) TaxID=1309411 RepID=A0AAE4BLH0_9DEIO|nr:hypothetical protein [Deinococcus soli (ex Cha et al. 2016)]MDR6216726.1 maltose-binding protein MalE [Deinococcus soli (ex Cha et al. 2016)]MDR6327547.1 maltose-binding protein MalE [Deinococcus soli (ex Cha et al. 2016)]MDR6749822.1 maltose-binding protein MalE [Deinococcus soli (ex Cha et al. 2016)]